MFPAATTTPTTAATSPPFLGSPRERRTALLIIAIVLFSAGDLVMTLEFMRTTGMFEANPIVRTLVSCTGSALSIGCFKALTVVVGASLLLRMRRHATAELAAWVMAIILLGVCVNWVQYAASIEHLDHWDWLSLVQEQSGWVTLPTS